MEKILFSIHHKINPLHIYCRLVERGFTQNASLRICRLYEQVIYRGLTLVIVMPFYVWKLFAHIK